MTTTVLHLSHNILIVYLGLAVADFSPAGIPTMKTFVNILMPSSFMAHHPHADPNSSKA